MTKKKLHTDSITITFKADHNGNFKKDCEDNKRHSHDWNVKIYFETNKLTDEGVIINFNEIENIEKEFEGKYLNELECFKNTTPTTEVIADFICEKISKLMISKNYKIRTIVNETPTRSASCCIESEEEGQ